MTVICAICGAAFAAKRRDARYCSQRCRQRAYESRQAGTIRQAIARQTQGPTQLYRHFDADGNLLYVGISCSAFQRFCRGHTQRSKWASTVKNITIEMFASRDEALNAEALAIQNEKPRFNGTASVITAPASVRPDDLTDKVITGCDFPDDDAFDRDLDELAARVQRGERLTSAEIADGIALCSRALDGGIDGEDEWLALRLLGRLDALQAVDRDA